MIRKSFFMLAVVAAVIFAPGLIDYAAGALLELFGG